MTDYILTVASSLARCRGGVDARSGEKKHTCKKPQCYIPSFCLLYCSRTSTSVVFSYMKFLNQIFNIPLVGRYEEIGEFVVMLVNGRNT